jgi:hypothetical protein
MTLTTTNWARIDDGHTNSPAALSVSRSARLLHIEALVWCNKHETDGSLPRAALAQITDHEDPARGAKELVTAGTWSEVDGGWLVTFDGQETSDARHARVAVQAEKRAANARDQTRFRRHRADDHTMCDRCEVVLSAHAADDHTMCSDKTPGHAKSKAYSKPYIGRSVPSVPTTPKGVGRTEGAPHTATASARATASAERSPKSQVKGSTEPKGKGKRPAGAKAKRRKWTQDEVGLLLIRVQNGEPISEIADQHQRTETAIYLKIAEVRRANAKVQAMIDADSKGERHRAPPMPSGTPADNPTRLPPRDSPLKSPVFNGCPICGRTDPPHADDCPLSQPKKLPT